MSIKGSSYPQEQRLTWLFDRIFLMEESCFRIIENSKMHNSSKNDIVYAAFDRFPSPKGAATHIDAFVSGLGRRFGTVRLITIQSEDAELNHIDVPQVLRHFSNAEKTRVDWTPTPDWKAPGVCHYPLPAPGENLFERTLSFRRKKNKGDALFPNSGSSS
jgi:hypothetical protein